MQIEGDNYCQRFMSFIGKVVEKHRHILREPETVLAENIYIFFPAIHTEGTEEGKDLVHRGE
jgi:hypothetical protein